MALIKHPTSPYWYEEFWLDGVRHRISTRKVNRREAEAEARRIRVRFETESRSDTHPSNLIPDLSVVAQWDIARAERGGAQPATVDQIRRVWARLSAWFEVPERVTGESLEKYVDTRLSRGIRRQTISTDLMILKRGLMLAWKKHYDVELPREWPNLKPDAADPRQSSKWHDLKKVRVFLNALRGEARVMSLLAVTTGARHEEQYRLVPEDLYDGLLTIHSKVRQANRRTRVVAVPMPFVSVLRAALPFRQRDHDSAWQTASAKAYGHRNVRITLRDLRSIFNTLASEIDPMGAKLCMGHSSEINMRYQHAHLERLTKIADHVWARVAVSAATPDHD